MASILNIVNSENMLKVFRNIRKVGLITTIQYVVSDFVFDYKYKVDTINTNTLDELDIDSPNKAYGHYYEGTNAHIFKTMFSHVKLDYSNSCFVDFGSGKGKAMFMAAELGFGKIIGVEFSLELVESCRANFEIFKSKFKGKTQFEILHMDATEYEIPADANFLFFSNPFDEPLILKVIENIFKSLEKSPREILVMHLYPQGNMAFANHPRFQFQHESRDGFIFTVKPN